MEQPALPFRLAAEVVGTFGFLFLGFSGIAMSVQQPGSIGSTGIAAGFGLGLALMVFAFGHVSGGHFNPAVSLGLAVGGRFPLRDVLPYWAAQLVGGFLAAGLSALVYSDEVRDGVVNTPGSAFGDGSALVLEIVAVALFLIVIGAVATDTAPWSGVLAPVAIGGFILTALMVLGPATGGSFNPARSIAPAVIAGEFSSLWVYVLGPLAGGAVGAVLFAVIRQRRIALPA